MGRRLPHIVLGVFFSLAIALGGASAAIARGAPAGVTEVVLCSGAGAVTVGLDAAGRPVAPSLPHDCGACPVCALLGAPMAVPPILPAAPEMAIAVVSPRIVPAPGAGLRHLWRPARGPPMES